MKLKLSYTISISTTSIIGLAVWLTKKFFPLGLDNALLWLKSHILLLIFLLISLIEYSYIFILKRKFKLTPNFVVYWDKDHNPYCRVCKTLLGFADCNRNFPYSDSFCDNCDKPIILQDDKENPLTISEAKILIKNKQRFEKIDISDLDSE